MSAICVPNNCTGCSACTAACPKHALSMQRTEYGFYRPALDVEKCVDCGICGKVCPVLNDQIELERILNTFMAKSSNVAQRERSSSGGIFPLLAQYILSENGVVYAAKGINAVYVKHTRIDKAEALVRTQGSRYIQSDLSDIFSAVKSDLKQGKKVLFAGTPCQIYGIKSFLGDSAGKRLYTVDLVCHGVMSSNIPREYLNNIGHTPEKSELKWTDKRTGWHQRSLVVSEYKQDTSNELHSEIYNTSIIGQLYQNNVCLNECCYDCKYKTIHSAADITLGDYWGIEKICPDFDDNQGVSLVIIHSEQGQFLFGKIENQLSYQISSFEDATSGQYALTRSSGRKFDNDCAYEILKTQGIMRLYRLTCHKTFFQKVIRKAKYIANKLRSVEG